MNEKGDIITDTAEIQRIIRGFYTDKLNNLEDMTKFLETYNLPRLNQEEIENLNRPATSKEIQSLIKKKSPTKKSPAPNGFSGKFYQKFN